MSDFIAQYPKTSFLLLNIFLISLEFIIPHPYVYKFTSLILTMIWSQKIYNGLVYIFNSGLFDNNVKAISSTREPETSIPRPTKAVIQPERYGALFQSSESAAQDAWDNYHHTALSAIIPCDSDTKSFGSESAPNAFELTPTQSNPFAHRAPSPPPPPSPPLRARSIRLEHITEESDEFCFRSPEELCLSNR